MHASERTGVYQHWGISTYAILGQKCSTVPRLERPRFKHCERTIARLSIVKGELMELPVHVYQVRDISMAHCIHHRSY